MIPSWQKRRSAFNHDWLKNKYLNYLDGFTKLLEMPRADRTLLRNLIGEDFPEWGKRRKEIQKLLNTFEKEMSPKGLFENALLKNCDAETREWLPDLVHGLWLARYPVREWTKGGNEAFVQADKEYGNIVDSLENDDLSDPKSLLPQFRDFKKACEKLSRAISSFPSYILVV